MKKLPKIYYLLALLVIAECILYIKGYSDEPEFPFDFNEGQDCITVKDVHPEDYAWSAGIRNGDIILNFNGIPYRNNIVSTSLNKYNPGDIVNLNVRRGNEEKTIPVKLTSKINNDLYFYIFYYLLIAIVFAIGIFVYLRKPEDRSARIFLLFAMVFAFCLNSQLFLGNKLYGIIRTALFNMTFPFLGAVLFHFFLLFPEENKIKKSIPLLPHIIYTASAFFSILGLFANLQFIFFGVHEYSVNIFNLILNYSLLWMSLTLLASLLLAIYNFNTFKRTEIHYQYFWVMTGVLFGLFPETMFGFFQPQFQSLANLKPEYMLLMWACGALILLFFISFAILKYRLWDIEIIIKRTLLYSFLTILLGGTYFIFAKGSEYLLNTTSNLAQLIGVLTSAVLFIPSREMIQKRMDKAFHHEKYEPTQAAMDFENYLIKHYTEEDIAHHIGEKINSFFHFQKFYFFLKEGTRFTCRYSCGKDDIALNYEIVINEIIKNRDFVPAGSLFSETAHSIEFIIPVKIENEIEGMFLVGSKKSEYPFSRKDIDLLKLLAARSSTILQLSRLYKNELERRGLIEKERTRISRDMHDEIGSSLTQIVVLSEIMQGETAGQDISKENLKKISSVSRQVIDNISEIIWAVNPKNDFLDNTAAYIREYASDLLESAGINYHMNFCEDIPPLSVNAEIRRTLFLAIKEILNNIVKHSHANNVHFTFLYNDPYNISISIKDDGRGFDINNTRKNGNGIKNISRRIIEMGGTPLITSAIGEGSIIQFSFKLPV